MITDRKVKFALVGAGRIANNHFGSIEQHAERCELVDVCDTDPAALAAAVERTGANGHTELASMLTSTTADCVIVTTPSGLHPRQTVQIAQAGLHVLSEKPMATRWEDALAMVKACDDAGVQLFVVKQNRQNATLQLLKRAMQEKRFGRIYNIAVNVFWTRPQDYYDQAKWRGTWEFDGGAFMNQASHYIDLLDWLVGPVESVMAYTSTQERDIEAEDSGVAALRWRNGAMGTLNVSMLTYPKNYEGSITILGEKGTVRVGGVAVNEIQQWDFADVHPDDQDIQSASYATTSVYGFGHPHYYDNVINVLTKGDKPLTDGRSGLKSMELLTALYRSSRDSQRVCLPLEL
jgi:UDP-N-acetyl-2-amino-2-deoxyglucuronate dehydrogenase